MRKPSSDTPGSKRSGPADDEPPQGRALARARQFALQRGLPAPAPEGQAEKPAAKDKRPARKKP